jgi:hypothetical protein
VALVDVTLSRSTIAPARTTPLQRRRLARRRPYRGLMQAHLAVAHEISAWWRLELRHGATGTHEIMGRRPMRSRAHQRAARQSGGDQADDQDGDPTSPRASSAG